MVAQTQQFALGGLARCGAQEELKDPLPHFLHRHRTVQDFAAVDVHVFFQTLEHQAVGRQLDAGCGFGVNKLLVLIFVLISQFVEVKDLPR